jgi:hypothetical protein
MELQDWAAQRNDHTAAPGDRQTNGKTSFILSGRFVFIFGAIVSFIVF